VPKSRAPITGYHLHRVLAEWGCHVRRSKGGRCIATVGDREIPIPIPGPSKKEVVDDKTLGYLAAAFEVSRPEFLDAVFDRKPISHGKPQPIADTDEGCVTKAEVTALLSELSGRRSTRDVIHAPVRPAS
jgi:hypothetical protein